MAARWWWPVLGLLATLVFLAVNGHLLMLSVLTESFTYFPISAEPFSAARLEDAGGLGRQNFRGGLGLALPVVTALLIVNLALGILTRAAPQLNIFAVGFPITLMVGMVSADAVASLFHSGDRATDSEGLQTMLDVAHIARPILRWRHNPAPRLIPGKTAQSSASFSSFLMISLRGS